MNAGSNRREPDPSCVITPLGAVPDPAVAETHTAVLFFAGERVYKVKKAVRFPFVDFTDRRARASACHREVELNRRLAPDVYLGVAGVVGPDGDVAEHAVVMRRLPSERRLAALARGGSDVGNEVRDVARLVAEFHNRASTGPDIDAAARVGHVRDLWSASLDELRRSSEAVADQGIVETITSLAMRYLDGRARLFDERIAGGHARDGHGDMLADDIFCLEDGPRILDCLEFDDTLRYGDVLADVAFLAMDLERLGRADAAEQFLRSYAELSGATWPASLAHHYIAYRALVRAKVAWLRHAQGDPQGAVEGTTLVDLCLRHLEPARVRLVLIGGLPGAGKTTLAGAIASSRGWIHLSSDETRKELAGIGREQPAAAPWGQGIYGDTQTAATYQRLIDQARVRLEHGESVILDASWSSSRWRTEAAACADATASDLVELVCAVPDDVAAFRLAARAREPAGPSDADANIRASMQPRFDPWPTATVVDTGTNAGSTTDLEL
jgi:aminoglycoside phosphotransferase family enzyme/predicted kinase